MSHTLSHEQEDWGMLPRAGASCGLPDSGFAPAPGAPAHPYGLPDSAPDPGCARQTTAWRDAGGKVHASRLEAIRADIIRVLREQANRGPECLADFLMQNPTPRAKLIALLQELGQ